MLTPTMIADESQTPALTADQKLNLQLLVRNAYPTVAGAWDAALNTFLDAEIATPTAKTKALKAVLTQLDSLPAEDVESQGDVASPTFLSTQANWRSLALDVLNVFAIQTGALTQQSWGLQQRTIADLTLADPNWVRQRQPIIKT